MPNSNVKKQSNMANAARPRPRNNRNRNNGKGGRQQQSRPADRNSDNSIRTNGTIISALSKQTSSMNISNLMSSPYAMARLTCCVPKTVPGIPDGSVSKSIRLCLSTIDRLSFTSTTTAKLQFNPWLPTSVALIEGTGTTLVNGQTVTTTAGATAVGLGIARSFSSLPQVNTRPGSLSNAVDVYNATTLRIVSQTHAIRYTGPVNTCAGVIRAFPNEWTITPNGTVTASSATTTAPTTNGIAIQILGQTGAVNAYAPYGNEILLVDGPSSAAIPVGSNAVSCRPEQGMTIRLGHKTGKFEAVPVRNIPPSLTWFSASTTTSLATLTHYFPFNGVCQPAVIAYDNDWQSQTVILENVNADASFSIETCVCVELMPIASSAFYPLTTGNPPANPAIINSVQKALRDHGTAVPGILNGPR